MNFEDSRDFAAACDSTDALASFRDAFSFPAERNGRAPVYLCGNSLGLQPKRAVEYVRAELDKWADKAVDGHFTGERPWLGYHRLAARGFAALTGALESEVVAMNTLTVNLHVLMASFYRPTPDRYRILVEEKAFPSDRYAVASQLRLAGFDPDDGIVEWRAAPETGLLETNSLGEILEQKGDSIALILLPGVQYYTGQVLDMATICKLGQEAGCRVGLDLAHAFGNIETKLHDWAPDFAAWCTYKYGNAGPGAIGGAFVHERHCAPGNLQQLHGWWGHAEDTRFEMSDEFTPAAGAELWQMSNPPVLALAPLVASMELFLAAGFGKLQKKSRHLTAYLRWLIETRFEKHIRVLTPDDAYGAQLSLIVKNGGGDARVVFDALCELNVTGDWRQPDVIRVAPAPLYNSYSDVFAFAERLQLALDRHAA